MNQVPKKLTSSIAFFKEENPEKKKFEKKNFFETLFFKFFFFKIFFLRIFFLWITNPWHGGVFKVHGKSRLQGFGKRYGGS